MITREDILNCVSQEEIMKKYFPGKFTMEHSILNPFRNDKTADCRFHFQGNTLLFMDFAHREYNGDCFKIAMLTTKKEFPQVLYQINRDMNLNLVSTGFHCKPKTGGIPRNQIPKKTKSFYSITCEFMKWSKFDLNYWNDRLISNNTLNIFKVNVCYRAWIEKGGEIFTYTRREPIYSYNIKDNIYEIYRPFSNKTEKFRTNSNSNIVKGWKQLPKTGNILIITKAYKDLMNYYELGYPAIAFNGESSIPSKHVIDELKERFKHIIIVYDEDDAGIEAAVKLNKLYNFPYWFLPKEYKQKDLNDFALNHGYEKFKKHFEPFIRTVIDKKNRS